LCTCRITHNDSTEKDPSDGNAVSELDDVELERGLCQAAEAPWPELQKTPSNVQKSVTFPAAAAAQPVFFVQLAPLVAA
jgi:hypothetical protein